MSSLKVWPLGPDDLGSNASMWLLGVFLNLSVPLLPVYRFDDNISTCTVVRT